MATAAITVSATCSGLPEGGLDQVSFSMANTSAANSVSIVSLTTAQGTANSVAMPSSAQFMIAIAASTNAFPWRWTQSTAEAGILMSSNGAGLLRIPGGSSCHFYTTGGTTFAIRVITY